MKSIKLYEEWLAEFTGPVGGSLHGTSGVDWSIIGTKNPSEVPNSFEPTMVEDFVIDLLQKKRNTVPVPGNLTIEEELPDIETIQSGLSDEDRVFMQSANNKPIALHVEAAKKAGVDLNEEWLQRGWDYATSAANHLKEIWKVKRPFETSSTIKGLVSTDSFSFPSSNATGSFYLAKMIGEQFPELKDDQMKLAQKISNSRVQAGVHYPTDIEVGKMLALGLL